MNSQDRQTESLAICAHKEYAASRRSTSSRPWNSVAIDELRGLPCGYSASKPSRQPPVAAASGSSRRALASPIPSFDLPPTEIRFMKRHHWPVAPRLKKKRRKVHSGTTQKVTYVRTNPRTTPANPQNGSK